MTDIGVFRYRGARTLTIFHEKELRGFAATWKKAKTAGVTLPKTKAPQYESMETLLHHVVSMAREYMVWICEKLELPDPQIKPTPAPDALEAQLDSHLDHLLEQWRKPLTEVRGLMFYQQGYPAPWKVDYCIDAMLEHAVLHPMRHNFQLTELISK